MIKIEGNYYMDNDGMQFILKEDTWKTTVDSKTKEEKEVFKNHGYYRHPEQALEKFVNLKVSKSDSKTVVELVKEIKELKQFFIDLFKEDSK